MKFKFLESTNLNIDTVAFSIPYQGSALKVKYLAILDEETGEIRKCKKMNALKSAKGHHSLIFSHSPSRQCIDIEGALYGFTYGQNLFTGCDVKDICQTVVESVGKFMGMSRQAIDDLKEKPITLKRLDIAVNFSCESPEETDDLLLQINRQFVEYSPAGMYFTTAYWKAQRGRNYEFGFYNKGKEMASFAQRSPTVDDDWKRLAAEAANILRMELRLRTGELRLLNMDSADSATPDRLRSIFQKYFARLPILNVSRGIWDEEVLEQLTPAERRHYALHALGAPMDKLYKPRALARIRNEFRRRGIDLKCPAGNLQTILLADVLAEEKRIPKIGAWLIDAGRAPQTLTPALGLGNTLAAAEEASSPAPKRRRQGPLPVPRREGNPRRSQGSRKPQTQADRDDHDRFWATLLSMPPVRRK